MRYIQASNIDDVCKTLLLKLIKKKQEADIKEKHKTIWYIVSYFVLLCISIFLAVDLIWPNWPSVSKMITIFLHETSYFLMILLSIGLFGFSRIKEKKFDEAEDEYDELRIEIIKRSEELWQGELWTIRNDIFQYLDNTYDINLYHES